MEKINFKKLHDVFLLILNIFTKFLVSHLNRELFDSSQGIPSVLENSCPANWIVLSIFQFLISFVWLLPSLFAISTSILCFPANFLVQGFWFGLPTFGPEWRPRFKLWSNRYEAALGRLPQPIRKSLKTLSRRRCFPCAKMWRFWIIPLAQI